MCWAHCKLLLYIFTGLQSACDWSTNILFCNLEFFSVIVSSCVDAHLSDGLSFRKFFMDVSSFENMTTLPFFSSDKSIPLEVIFVFIHTSFNHCHKTNESSTLARLIVSTNSLVLRFVVLNEATIISLFKRGH